MYQDLAPFVNNDQLALDFLRYNYIGQDFSRPINKPETADTIKGEAVYQLMLKNNYIGKENSEPDCLAYVLCEYTIGNIGYWHNKINNKQVSDKDTAGKIYDEVYRRWKDLSQLARKFYSTHLYLTKKENGIESVIRDFDNIESIENLVGRQNIFLHLRKAANGQILFRESLPYLPIGAYFKDDNGNITNITPNNQDYLKKIYDKYRYRERNNPLRLNYSRFISNVIAHAGENVDLYKVQISSEIDNLDDLYPSDPQANGVKFSRDETGCLVRNGTKLDDAKLLEDLKDETNCWGTGIKNNGTNCADVNKCLLDVKTHNISNCKDELQDEELFNVPSDVVRNINPRIMTLIVENLGVRIKRDSNGFRTCEDFSSWLNRTPIRDIVRKNKNLKRYIQTIIETLNSNPVILNKPSTKRANTYGLSTFTTPDALKSNGNTRNLGDLLLYTKQFGMTNSGVPQYPSNMRFILSGGAEPDSDNASQLRKLFKVLFDELDKAGVPLVDRDQNRVFASIDQMSKLELQLPRLLEDLRVYTDLITMLNDKDKDKTEFEDFSDIRNNKEKLSELVNKVNKQIQKNITKQNLIYNILYNKVQLPLLSRLVMF